MPEISLISMTCLLVIGKSNVKKPRRDLNSQSSDSKSDALSIRPRGHEFPCLRTSKIKIINYLVWNIS